MKKIILKVALLACAAVAGNVQAVGVSGQGTWETTLQGRDINGNAVAGNAANSVFLYDDVLNVTWLRDANYARTSAYAVADSLGRMNWGEANAWAANLVVGAYDDWRLPTMISNPNATGSYSGGTDFGYNVRTKDGIATQFQAGQTVFSEMAHLWYSTLGNKAYCPPGNTSCSGAFTPQPGWGLTNRGNFQNLQASPYLSGLEFEPNPDGVWYFEAYDGFQGSTGKADSLYALAVRSGDVLAAPVPEPETYALMLAGLAVVGAAARRRKAA